MVVALEKSFRLSKEFVVVADRPLLVNNTTSTTRPTAGDGGFVVVVRRCL